MTDDQLLRRVNMALANAGGTHDFYSDVLPLLQAGKAQCFQHEMGLAITELRDHPRLREVNVWLAAGRMADCLALQEPIEAFARKVGAHRIVGVGRSGWARAGRAMGLHATGVRLEKWLAEPVT